MDMAVVIDNPTRECSSGAGDMWRWQAVHARLFVAYSTDIVYFLPIVNRPSQIFNLAATIASRVTSAALSFAIKKCHVFLSRHELYIFNLFTIDLQSVWMTGLLLHHENSAFASLPNAFCNLRNGFIGYNVLVTGHDLQLFFLLSLFHAIEGSRRFAKSKFSINHSLIVSMVSLSLTRFVGWYGNSIQFAQLSPSSASYLKTQ